MPITLTRAQSRALDHAATQQLAIPSILLMEHAAASLLRHTLQLLDSIRTPSAGPGSAPAANNNTLILLFAGPGNNGGDAYALARLLHLQHIPLILILVGPLPNPISDAGINRTIAERLELPFIVFDHHTRSALETHISAATAQTTKPDTIQSQTSLKRIVIIDALLGTGASRPLSPDIASAVSLINELRQAHHHTRTLAVDLPTGLDADTGEPLGTTAMPDAATPPRTAAPTRPTVVKADLTVTLAALKPGLLANAATPYIGHIEIGDIGLPHHFIAHFAATAQR